MHGPQARFKRFAWGVLLYTLATAAWGAYVRATSSGAGCGAHWPLCNGQVVPQGAATKTLVELSHRVSSGIAAIAVAVLAIWAWRAFPKGSPVRKGAVASAAFIAGEVAIGAGIVLFKLVEHDATTIRAFSMSLHLVNTFFLIAALALTAWWASGGARVTLRGQGAALPLLAVAFGGMILLGTSGAVTALGDTLFPARSLADGFAQDLSPTTHLFVKLRLAHPTMAVVVAMLVVATANMMRWLRRTSRAVSIVSRVLALTIVVQLGAGLLNVWLLAPVWMQLVHLLLADAVWLGLVFLAASALAERAPARVGDQAPDISFIMSKNGPAPSSDVPPSTSSVVPVTNAPAGETR